MGYRRWQRPVTTPRGHRGPRDSAATQPVSATGEVYDPRLPRCGMPCVVSTAPWRRSGTGWMWTCLSCRIASDAGVLDPGNRGAAPAVSAPADSKAKELWDRVNRLQGQLAALEASAAERLNAAHTKADDNASAALQALRPATSCGPLRLPSRLAWRLASGYCSRRSPQEAHQQPGPCAEGRRDHRRG